jgi:multimeric flavodoxin WrbA
MKLLIVLGSRNPQGQTARAASALLQGVLDAGGEGQQVFLPKMQIERCRQCEDNGWGLCRSEGRCVIEDDFARLVDQIREADAVAFATPVYFSGLSESMKAFADRLARIQHFRDVADRSGIEGKRAIGVCVAGGGGGGAPKCAGDLEWILRICGFDIVDMVPARRQNLDMKCDVLRITGRWLAGGQRDQAGAEQG